MSTNSGFLVCMHRKRGGHDGFFVFRSSRNAAAVGGNRTPYLVAQQLNVIATAAGDGEIRQRGATTKARKSLCQALRPLARAPLSLERKKYQ